MLSMTRLLGFLAGLAVLYVLWRIMRWLLSRMKRPAGRGAGLLTELKALAASATLLVGFVAIGAVWHRPMLSLAGTGPNDIIADFHSHTNVSHDVKDTWMRGFDAEANRRWHTRAGFDAAFVTDHNVASDLSSVVGSQLRGSTILCPGVEISAWRAHIVLLGDPRPVDRRQYKGLDGLLALLATSDSAHGALSLASLPEYRRNHWNRIDSLAAAGLDGFEIVNASPKANELTRAETDRIIATARSHNRFVAGVSDSHGWGATSMVWNLVRTSDLERQDPCSAVTRQLRTGFGAVRIVERHRLRPDDWWPSLATPIGVVWETWRSIPFALVASWLLWIWAVAMIRRRRGEAP
jgi:hypothetical protein